MNENERINKLEKELKELRSNVESSSIELQNTIEELKKAVVDIRSAVSEIENPFNLLRAVTNEEDLKKINKARSIIERKILKAKDEVEEEAVEEETPKTEETTEVVEVEVPTETRAERPPKEKVTAIRFKHGSSLIRWIYTMLDLGFDEESIGKICDYCEFFGLIPEGSSVCVSNLVGAVVKARSQGLSEEEVILSIYGAADATGIKVNPEEVSGLIIEVLKRKKQGNKLV